ncbi:MAG: DUF1385 domain-containing protein [Fimbriimonadaceae bacterium]|nr:DUF1385 domain-containing protein [Fimbriimonadaceae bacterium]
MSKSPEAVPQQAEYLQFGGMAVPEGVMMRSPTHYAVACRAPNGEIVTKLEPLEKTFLGRQLWLKKPFLRGMLGMLDTMALGMRAMKYAAEVQIDPAYQTEDAEPVKPLGGSKLTENLVILATLAGSLAFGFFVFNVVPQFTTEYGVRAATGSMKKNEHLLLSNYVAEIVKAIFVIGYLLLIRRLPQIYEVFRYHGAEHKALNALEAGADLTVENCLAQTKLHPRCGTNFVIIVTIVSFLLFPLIPRDLFVPADSPGWLVALTRLPVELLCLPIVAGISYEVIRFAGRRRDQRWVMTILKPGLWTQLITTAEPNEEQQEVAIAALKSVLEPS